MRRGPSASQGFGISPQRRACGERLSRFCPREVLCDVGHGPWLTARCASPRGTKGEVPRETEAEGPRRRSRALRWIDRHGPLQVHCPPRSPGPAVVQAARGSERSQRFDLLFDHIVHDTPFLIRYSHFWPIILVVLVGERSIIPKTRSFFQLLMSYPPDLRAITRADVDKRSAPWGPRPAWPQFGLPARTFGEHWRVTSSPH